MRGLKSRTARPAGRTKTARVRLVRSYGPAGVSRRPEPPRQAGAAAASARPLGSRRLPPSWHGASGSCGPMCWRRAGPGGAGHSAGGADGAGARAGARTRDRLAEFRPFGGCGCGGGGVEQEVGKTAGRTGRKSDGAGRLKVCGRESASKDSAGSFHRPDTTRTLRSQSHRLYQLGTTVCGSVTSTRAGETPSARPSPHRLLGDPQASQSCVAPFSSGPACSVDATMPALA